MIARHARVVVAALCLLAACGDDDDDALEDVEDQTTVTTTTEAPPTSPPHEVSEGLAPEDVLINLQDLPPGWIPVDDDVDIGDEEGSDVVSPPECVSLGEEFETPLTVSASFQNPKPPEFLTHQVSQFESEPDATGAVDSFINVMNSCPQFIVDDGTTEGEVAVLGFLSLDQLAYGEYVSFAWATTNLSTGQVLYWSWLIFQSDVYVTSLTLVDTSQPLSFFPQDFAELAAYKLPPPEGFTTDDSGDPAVDVGDPGVDGAGNTEGDPGIDTSLEDFADLVQGCQNGDMAVCDQLYFETPSFSEAEAVALTCGGAVPISENRGGDCEALIGD